MPSQTSVQAHNNLQAMIMPVGSSQHQGQTYNPNGNQETAYQGDSMYQNPFTQFGTSTYAPPGVYPPLGLPLGPPAAIPETLHHYDPASQQPSQGYQPMAMMNNWPPARQTHQDTAPPFKPPAGQPAYFNNPGPSHNTQPVNDGAGFLDSLLNLDPLDSTDDEDDSQPLEMGGQP